MEERDLISVTFVICATAFFYRADVGRPSQSYIEHMAGNSHTERHMGAQNMQVIFFFARSYTWYNCCILQTHVCVHCTI